jgi:hypothetical protein
VPGAGLAQSLRIQQQRRELSALGAELGTDVLFLKGAWADPVLYGGRGERWSNDIDILVAADVFSAFGAALRARGYEPRRVATHPVTVAAQRARLYHAPPPALPVDVHRGLSHRPWFDLPAAACMARAHSYPSVDGPIRSLSPDDQVLFAAAHYAQHGLELDRRHVDDVERLVRRFPVDWQVVGRRARRGGLPLALGWLCEELHRRGADVPAEHRRLDPIARLRLAAALDVARPGPWRRHLREGRRRVLTLALLSTRPTALPRFAARYLALRTADWIRAAGDR